MDTIVTDQHRTVGRYATCHSAGGPAWERRHTGKQSATLLRVVDCCQQLRNRHVAVTVRVDGGAFCFDAAERVVVAEDDLVDEHYTVSVAVTDARLRFRTHRAQAPECNDEQC